MGMDQQLLRATDHPKDEELEVQQCSLQAVSPSEPGATLPQHRHASSDSEEKNGDDGLSFVEASQGGWGTSSDEAWFSSSRAEDGRSNCIRSGSGPGLSLGGASDVRVLSRQETWKNKNLSIIRLLLRICLSVAVIWLMVAAVNVCLWMLVYTHSDLNELHAVCILRYVLMGCVSPSK